MNAQQDIYFKSIHDFLLVFPDEQACTNHLEQIRWGGVIVSPFDETSKVYKTARGFKCKNTGKYFNAKTGTIFESSNIKLMKWFLALYVFSSHKKGISSYQLARDIDVTQKSAWFMLHRLRHAFGNTQNEEFDSIVEIDETYVGGNEKNKHADKKNSERGRSLKTKMPVLGMKDRKTGNVSASVVVDTKSESLYPVIFNQVKGGTVVITDEYHSYHRLNQYYDHNRVVHSAKQYVDGVFHTNGIENFWSHLKRGINGIYHWVSFEHLQSYVNEYALRYNTRTFSTSSRFDYILSNMTCRLTYKELTK
jgi:transposase-like protein